MRRRLLLTADAVGGVWQYACDLAACLAPHGWEAVIAVLGPDPSDEQRKLTRSRVVATGLTLDWMSDGPEAVLAAGDAMAALARQQKVDLVQLNGPALGARADFGVPVVAVEHGGLATWWAAVERSPLPQELAWNRDLTAAGLRRADAVVAPSAAHGADVRRAYGLPKSPVAIHNGRRQMELLGGFNPSGGAFTAGRLWDQAKDVGTLDRAAARTAAPFRAAGALVGPHGRTERPGNLISLGLLSDEALAAEYARRPIFVTAALFEPFGLTALEAAQAGCPLVLSDIPTFRELWEGVATFVEPGDAAGFADAIDRLASDAFVHAAAGLKAVERSARYTPAACAAAMADLYDGLLDRRDAA